MGWFEKKVYKKQKNGSWKCVKCELEKAPHEVGRWNQSGVLEKKSSAGERTSFFREKTRSGINQKVTKIRTYFGRNERVDRNLITTSNRLPKKWRDKWNYLANSKRK